MWGVEGARGAGPGGFGDGGGVGLDVEEVGEQGGEEDGDEGPEEKGPGDGEALGCVEGERKGVIWGHDGWGCWRFCGGLDGEEEGRVEGYPGRTVGDAVGIGVCDEAGGG